MATPFKGGILTEWNVWENVYHPANERAGGTQFCIGNGLMGVRGSYEELETKDVQGLFMNNVFRKSVVRQFCVADTFCRKNISSTKNLCRLPKKFTSFKICRKVKWDDGKGNITSGLFFTALL